MLSNTFRCVRSITAAAAWIMVCAYSTVAAELAVTADAYAPVLSGPSNGSLNRVAQVPPQGAPVQGAQPGQSTIPTPSSQPTSASPLQGAQPGQSTVPPSTSTPPGTGPMSGIPGAAVQPVPTVPQVINAPGARVAPPVPPVLPPQGALTDDVAPAAEALPPQRDYSLETTPEAIFVEPDGSTVEFEGDVHGKRGVRPYGGGHPWDWSWGCGGSPYRTHGMCDDWKVGCRWHITVDGVVWSREDANLAAIQTQMPNSFVSVGALGNGIVGTPTLEQFEEEGGARLTLTSQVGKYTGWDVQFAYEGVPEWNSSIVYPVQQFDLDYPLDPTPAPPAPFPQGTLQRSLHYRSTLHSAELNALPGANKTWRPVFGFRYFAFDDEINDSINQQAQPPLAGPADAVDVGGAGPEDMEFQPIGPAVTTDRLNLFDIQNNLIGCQIGLLHDTWQVNRRFAFEGIVNAGVYYNRVKYTNLRGIFTTQVYADNTNSLTNDESRIDFSDTVNNDVREYSEISYHGEASLTGVCRLNKCWALRGGYQVLWIANIHTAEDAYLGNENVTDDLLFHGWHAGIECRR